MARGKFRANIVTWDDLDFDDAIPSFPDQKFLAEGDSWFTISGIPAFNLLFELRFQKHTLIVNCGFPGDTIKKMSTISRNRNLREAMTTPGYSWDAILLSGGGNDFFDEADEIVLPRDARRTGPITDPADYCDQDFLRQLVAEVQEGYRRIASLRDCERSRSKGVPILTHTYDYATPRNAPVRLLFGSLGPWLHREFTRKEVPGQDWVPLADYLADRLADCLIELQEGPDPIENFQVVDTRKTLKRSEPGSRGDNNDWQNEIHPNDGGYEKLAKRIEPMLESLVE